MEITEDNKNISEKQSSLLSEIMPYIVCGLLAIILVGLSIRDTFLQREAVRHTAQGVVVPHINASLLLQGRTQFNGDKNAPYTLVEFGDYECPPCRHAQPIVDNVLRKYSGHIKLDFRELPLSAIHPHALEAAIAAESARFKGDFWYVHDQLYKTDLYRPYAVERVLKAVGGKVYVKKAESQLDVDARLEKLLSVNSTPSFFLCKPNGDVVRLSNIGAINANLEN